MWSMKQLIGYCLMLAAAVFVIASASFQFSVGLVGDLNAILVDDHGVNISDHVKVQLIRTAFFSCVWVSVIGICIGGACVGVLFRAFSRQPPEGAGAS